MGIWTRMHDKQTEPICWHKYSKYQCILHLAPVPWPYVAHCQLFCFCGVNQSNFCFNESKFGKKSHNLKFNFLKAKSSELCSTIYATWNSYPLFIVSRCCSIASLQSFFHQVFTYLFSCEGSLNNLFFLADLYFKNNWLFCIHGAVGQFKVQPFFSSVISLDSSFQTLTNWCCQKMSLCFVEFSSEFEAWNANSYVHPLMSRNLESLTLE